MLPRPSFRMPQLPARWRDGEGREHAFGGRWGMDGPPEDAYSRVTHPQRYAPLHDVADALVAHVLAVYDCVAEEEAPEEHELRAVRLRAVPGTAGVHIAWTDFPGVRARLGSGDEVAAPLCGCDACDEDLQRTAEALRDAVLDAVAGARDARSAARGAGWPLRSS